MLHDYTTEHDILYILYLNYPPHDLPFLRFLSLEPLGKVMSSVGVDYSSGFYMTYRGVMVYFA